MSTQACDLQTKEGLAGGLWHGEFSTGNAGGDSGGEDGWIKCRGAEKEVAYNWYGPGLTLIVPIMVMGTIQRVDQDDR